MRSRQNILMSIIRAQGATLSGIEKQIAAEEDAMKQKCRGAVKVFADEFSHTSRARGGCARTRR